MPRRRHLPVLGLASAIACAPAPGSSAAPVYTPRVRDVTITTVPLLVKEATTVYPFLTSAFVAGGALDGKEVYGFSRSSITVVQGDTIHFTFVNPEDDVHSFVVPDFMQALPGNSTTTATWIAKRAGIYAFKCSVPTHLPMMWGQRVVLSPVAVRRGADSRRSKPLSPLDLRRTSCCCVTRYRSRHRVPSRRYTCHNAKYT